jgi:hypothetical protein
LGGLRSNGNLKECRQLPRHITPIVLLFAWNSGADLYWMINLTIDSPFPSVAKNGGAIQVLLYDLSCSPIHIAIVCCRAINHSLVSQCGPD